MNKTHTAVAAALMVTAVAAQASTWSDTYLGYRYGTSYHEPDNPQNITKDILSLTHASGYKYGSNFFNVDMLTSAGNDPASGGGGGAHEVYVVYRTTLSLSAVSGTPYKFGWVRDVGITAGFDYNAKDDQFSARVFKTAIGPKLSFDVPGYMDLALVFRTEHNHNWFASGPGYGSNGCVPQAGSSCNPDVHFKDTYALEGDWGIPLDWGIPAKFEGFFNYIGQKGKDGTGAQTKPETLLEAALMFDIGASAGHKGALYAGIGYQYWHNKFGNDASMDTSGGSTARVPQLELEMHF